MSAVSKTVFKAYVRKPWTASVLPKGWPRSLLGPEQFLVVDPPAELRVGTYTVRVDVEKLTGTFEEVPDA